MIPDFYSFITLFPPPPPPHPRLEHPSYPLPVPYDHPLSPPPFSLSISILIPPTPFLRLTRNKETQIQYLYEGRDGRKHERNKWIL